MRIDIRSSDGNTMTALGHARRLLKAVGANSDELDALTTAVFNAESAHQARLAITCATNGAIEFYDSDSDE